MRIWKWQLDVLGEQILMLPKGATLLTVQMQGDKCCLWALCDEIESTKERRYLAIYGTGHPLPDFEGRYLSTFQRDSGALVFHAFEVFPS